MIGHSRRFHLLTQELHSCQIKTKQNKTNISCKNAARDNSFHYTVGFRLLTSKEGLAKAMNLQKLFIVFFFAVCVSANCIFKKNAKSRNLSV